MGKPYTNHELAAIQNLSETMTAAQIGQMIGRSEKSVYDVARYRCIPMPKKVNRTLTTKQMKEVVSLKTAGMTFRQIAEITGLPLSSCLHLYRRSA
ncbi:hypothetical protein [Atlantibacter hermannii]|uniref:hypothetical protein n=1 Tax=Atlantibacter hermannii TaxID=565 RepID=UPI00289FAAF3|nr:hypothetical protein [Atlantibacter hermannii]